MHPAPIAASFDVQNRLISAAALPEAGAEERSAAAALGTPAGEAPDQNAAAAAAMFAAAGELGRSTASQQVPELRWAAAGVGACPPPLLEPRAGA